MGGKTNIKLEDIATMQGMTKPELKEVQKLLARAKAAQLTDDLLRGIRGAVEIKLGVVPQVNREIISRIDQLLAERKAFQYGITKKV